MLLEIKNLSVEYSRADKIIPALRNVSLSIEKGEMVGLIGESGCGKSTLALAIMDLISPTDGKITSGEILFEDEDLRRFSKERMRQTRGKDIGIIFQDPFTSLNPVLRIREQLKEAYLAHRPDSSAQQVESELKKSMLGVRLNDAERILNSYPHQISGGQRQRVMIAMAMLHRPKLLIADEPTTALDVTVQKEILELLAALKNEFNTAILLVTHHLGIVAHYTQKLCVLYGGEIVEKGTTRLTIKNPQHPYTRALLETVPKSEPLSTGAARKSRLATISGSPPDLTRLPSGCIFHPRCPVKVDECSQKTPHLRRIEEVDRDVSCHLAPFKQHGQ